MKIIGMILGVLAALCYIIVFAGLIVAAPMAAGYKPVVVLSGSMEPAYPVGSVVYYKSESFSNIKEGDVISYSINDDAQTVVTHRVSAKNESEMTFTTKGDANVSADSSPVAYANVRGKVMLYRIPYAGFFIRYVQNTYIIVTVFLILVAKLAFDHFTEARSENEQKQKLENPSLRVKQ